MQIYGYGPPRRQLLPDAARRSLPSRAAAESGVKERRGAALSYLKCRKIPNGNGDHNAVRTPICLRPSFVQELQVLKAW